jgi:hypothetical protein
MIILAHYTVSLIAFFLIIFKNFLNFEKNNLVRIKISLVDGLHELNVLFKINILVINFLENKFI